MSRVPGRGRLLCSSGAVTPIAENVLLFVGPKRFYSFHVSVSDFRVVSHLFDKTGFCCSTQELRLPSQHLLPCLLHFTCDHSRLLKPLREVSISNCFSPSVIMGKFGHCFTQPSKLLSVWMFLERLIDNGERRVLTTVWHFRIPNTN